MENFSLKRFQTKKERKNQFFAKNSPHPSWKQRAVAGLVCHFSFLQHFHHSTRRNSLLSPYTTACAQRSCPRGRFKEMAFWRDADVIDVDNDEDLTHVLEQSKKDEEERCVCECVRACALLNVACAVAVYVVRLFDLFRFRNSIISD